MLSDRSCVASIQLPPNLPPSYRGDYACVNYSLKLCIELDDCRHNAQVGGDGGTVPLSRTILLKLPLVLRGSSSSNQSTTCAIFPDGETGDVAAHQFVGRVLPVLTRIQPRGFLFRGAVSSWLSSRTVHWLSVCVSSVRARAIWLPRLTCILKYVQRRRP